MPRIRIDTGLTSFYVDVPKELLLRYSIMSDGRRWLARRIAECVEEDPRYLEYMYFGGIKEELREIARDCIQRML